MIRIDEIYSNVFLPFIKDKNYTALHWFDPFGSTNYHDLCSQPIVDGVANRYIFWDQEPFYKELLIKFLDQFKTYFDGPVTIVHSEYNSNDVDWLENTYNIKTCYYFFHGWAALDWYRGYDRSFLHQDKKLQHTYLCPNNIVGGERTHRLELFSELGKRNLLNDNLISMPAVCPHESETVEQLLNNLSLFVPDVELPLTIDSYDNHASNSHQITLWSQAGSTLVHVVTETVYKGRKNHLTEKTFKPIVLQQPFIVVGNRGSLQYLKRYGFRTFSDAWDESYDDADDATRVEKVAALLEELEHADRDYLYELCLPAIKHNYNWFYSGGFERVLWDELVEMLNQW
jgi:hypothetical protein